MTNRKARARDLVGRRIVDVEIRPFNMGKGFGWSSDPRITLDNGTVLRFVVDQADPDDGVSMYVSRDREAPRKASDERARARLLEAARAVVRAADSSDGHWAEVSREAIDRLRKAINS